jgi:hypothetical protein
MDYLEIYQYTRGCLSQQSKTIDTEPRWHKKPGNAGDHSICFLTKTGSKNNIEYLIANWTL